jgi:hypothetical protein
MESILKQHALGLAAAQILGFTDDFNSHEKWYAGYQLLADNVDNGVEPDHVSIWEPFENLTWEEVLNQINTEADAIHDTLKRTLELAKVGLIDAAIECDLDSDFNNLNIEGMVERGASKLLEAENVSS